MMKVIAAPEVEAYDYLVGVMGIGYGSSTFTFGLQLIMHVPYHTK